MANPPGWANKPNNKVSKQEMGTPKGSVYLKVPSIDTLIKQQGMRVRVYRTMLCPNVKSIDGGEHQIDCQLCSGNGFVDTNPIDTLAILQSQDLEKVHRAEGYWDGNTISATFSRGVELQYFTLVELLDFSSAFFERIKRQAGSVDVLKYKASKINVIMDSSGKQYFIDNDFELDVNGSIRWLANRGPDSSTIYSIHYDSLIQFRALRAMHVHRFVQDGQKKEHIEMVKLPEEWMLQREFLVKRKDHIGNELAVNLIRESDSDET